MQDRRLSTVISEITRGKASAEAELRRFKRIPPADTMGGAVEACNLDKVTFGSSAETMVVTSRPYSGIYRHVLEPQTKRKYGVTPPHAMPSHMMRPESQDGWVYTKQAEGWNSYGSRTLTCPVFYFE